MEDIKKKREVQFPSFSAFRTNYGNATAPKYDNSTTMFKSRKKLEFEIRIRVTFQSIKQSL